MANEKFEKQIITAPNAPTPIGPYSAAIRVGNFMFTSGQTGVDPTSRQLVGNDVSSQARQVFKNIRAVLEAAGASLDNVVKTTVFLAHMSDFAEMNSVYAEEFGNNRPARSTVEVGRLPGDALVEIETVVFLG